MISGDRNTDSRWFLGVSMGTIDSVINSPWWLLCQWAKYNRAHREDGVTIRDAIGREQKVVFINESGLYSLILSSKRVSLTKRGSWYNSAL